MHAFTRTPTLLHSAMSMKYKPIYWLLVFFCAGTSLHIAMICLHSLEPARNQQHGRLVVAPLLDNVLLKLVSASKMSEDVPFAFNSADYLNGIVLLRFFSDSHVGRQILIMQHVTGAR